MQQKEIRYTGITTTPSDYDCQDGDISAMMNLINENGNLVPVTPPETLFTLGNNQKVLYIHKTSDYCNYIIYDTNEGDTTGRIYYFDKNPLDFKNITSITDKELYQINSIGNTLVILTNEGLIYALYKSGDYEILGSNPPFPSISFRLKGGISEVKSFDINFNKKTPYYTEVYDHLLNLSMLERVLLDEPITAETIYANINPDYQAIKSGNRFQYDFMIRYAYKLYDGKLYMSSVPIYINAGSGTPYFMYIYKISRDSTTKSDNYGVYRFVDSIGIKMRRLSSQLYYQIINEKEIVTELEKWKDLIKEISFFITPPLHYIDQNFQPIKDKTTSKSASIDTEGAIESDFTMSTGIKDGYGADVYHKANYPFDFFSDNTVGNRYIPLMIKENGEDGIYTFRHIASIAVKEIKSGEQILPIENGVLDSLDNREVFKGDSDVIHKLVARSSFVYNARLNIANIFAIPQEYPIESCVAYTNGALLSASYARIENYSFKAYVFIESSNTNILVVESSSLKLKDIGKYFFYPDVNAFKVIIERTNEKGEKTYVSSKLEEHNQFKAAYTDSLSSDYSADFDMSIIEKTTRGFYHPNKIYTSEVNNPFSFPESGVNTISGEILGVRSATKALSQGQFGQFPLYAFTSEGIWALEVSSEGKYISKQPATRDVCNNPDSITQIDTAVLFTSERGIMLIQGSESICISDVLNKRSFNISTLRGYEQLAQMSDLTVQHFKHYDFTKYIKGCTMSYDYTNQRIIVFNKEYPYAYVYSLQSKAWGMIPSDFTNSINSYPESYIMTKSNTLVNVSNTGNEVTKAIKGIIITRPLKLDAPDILKTIIQSIHRGVFKTGKIKTVLYGSRDCINYTPIASSINHAIRSIHGSPYKYFRYAIITELSPGECLSGTSIIFETKQTNKLR